MDNQNKDYNEKDYNEEIDDKEPAGLTDDEPAEDSGQIEDFRPDEDFDSKFEDEEPDGRGWICGTPYIMEEEAKNRREQEQERNPEWDNIPPPDKFSAWKENDGAETIISGGKVLPPLTPARRVAEGALMAALATILGLLAFYAPLFNTVLLILYPIPIAYLIKRHNVATGLMAFAVSAALLTLLLNIANAAFVILSMGAVGIWYGVAFRCNIKPIRTLGVGTVLAAASVVVTMLLSLWTMGSSVADLTTYMTEYIRETVNMMQSMGVFDMLSGGVSVEEYTQNMIDMLSMLVPGMLVVVAMLEALLCYIITGYIMRRLGLSAATLPKFREWRLVWPALWGLIVALLAYIGYHYLEYEWLKTLAINILYIYYPILLLTGISLMVWMVKNVRSYFLPIMVIIGLFIFPSAALISVLMFGLFDALVDFRSWVRKNTEKNTKK